MSIHSNANMAAGSVDVRLGPGVVVSVEVPDLNAINYGEVVRAARLEHYRAIADAVARGRLRFVGHCRSLAKPWRYRDAQW